MIQLFFASELGWALSNNNLGFVQFGFICKY